MTTTREAALEAALRAAQDHIRSGSDHDYPLLDDIDAALSTPATEPQAYVEGLEAACAKTYDTLCEGFCTDISVGYCDKAMIADCGGCQSRAALAARPAPQPAADTRVVVKPLVWEGHTARTPFGSYAVHDCRGYGQTYRLRLPMGAEGTSVLAHGAELMFDNQELAQAAAEADWQNRNAIIGSAILALRDKPAPAVTVQDAIREVWGCCEELEDEALAKLSVVKTEHEKGFWTGQKMTAKRIRRATQMPTAGGGDE